MASKIQRELAFLLTGRDVSASKSMKGVSRNITSLERHSGKAFTNISRNMERGFLLGGAAAAGAIGYAAKAAMDWESAFTGVRKTVEGTPEQLAAIGQGIRDMSKVMPTSATELAAIAENAGALGIARGDILDFTKVVAMIGATTNVSTDEAGAALGQLQNALNLTGDDFDNFGAALVDLGNKGSSTESKILDVAGRVAGAGNGIGLSKDQVLGWAAAAANLPMQAEIAGTSLQRFFQIVQTSSNDGGAKLNLLAKTAGMTARGFKRAFNRDASGALSKFLKGLSKVPKGKRLGIIQDIFGKGTGLTRLIQTLAGSIDRNLLPALDDSKKAWAENTAMQEEYEKRVATTASQFEIFKHNVEDAAITVGTQLLPIMTELAKEGVDWLTDHQAEIKAFGDDLATGIRDAVTWAKSLDWDAMASALGTAAGFAGDMVSWFNSLDPGIQAFLITGFAANKFTGGVIGDVIGELGKGLIKGVLGMNAAVVNINAGVVNSKGGPSTPGTPGGPGGKPGVGKPGTPGMPDPGTKGNLPGVIGMIVASSVIVRGDTVKGMPGGAVTDRQLLADLKTMLAAGRGGESVGNNETVIQAIKRLEAIGVRVGSFVGVQGTVANDPTGFLNSGSGSKLLKTLGDTHSEQLATTKAVDAVKGKQAESLVAFRAGERATQYAGVATASAAGRAGATAAMASFGAAGRIVSAIASNRPIVTVTVSVPGVKVNYGSSTGSAGGGNRTQKPS